jgi:hypothetical protein
LNEANQWGRQEGVLVRHSNLSSLLLAVDTVHAPWDMQRHLPKDHEYEYFSYLLHLHEILSCDVVICTVPSNYCRLIDELRTTIGRNAKGFNADVSVETCKSPPCIRNFGLANFEGEVYDPLTRIW